MRWRMGISVFRETADGYGWLIIIDHPQANLYSLYGHLSPSRWKLETGTEVRRGHLIAYLGDPDENGGSAEEPLEPHLHFGICAGQMADYPGRGEWRFMAGWIGLCPQDLGWLQPSLLSPARKYRLGIFTPKISFLTRWGVELFVSIAYVLCGTGMLVFAIKKRWRWLMLFPAIMVIAASIVLHNNRIKPLRRRHPEARGLLVMKRTQTGQRSPARRSQRDVGAHDFVDPGSLPNRRHVLVVDPTHHERSVTLVGGWMNQMVWLRPIPRGNRPGSQPSSRIAASKA